MCMGVHGCAWVCTECSIDSIHVKDGVVASRRKRAAPLVVRAHTNSHIQYHALLHTHTHTHRTLRSAWACSSAMECRDWRIRSSATSALTHVSPVTSCHRGSCTFCCRQGMRGGGGASGVRTVVEDGAKCSCATYASLAGIVAPVAIQVLVLARAVLVPVPACVCACVYMCACMCVCVCVCEGVGGVDPEGVGGGKIPAHLSTSRRSATWSSVRRVE